MPGVVPAKARRPEVELEGHLDDEAGRYSRRFYSFATRWMVNSVALHKEWHGPRQPLRLAKTLANTVVGRAGMLATQREREA